MNTIETTIARLKRLSKIADINNPESVRSALATLNWKNSTKTLCAVIYDGYLKFMSKKLNIKISWEIPKYTIQRKLPFIPTEEELDLLIKSATLRTSTLLQLLKETGARVGEILTIEWIDLDIQRKTIHIKPEKGSNPRILPLSNLVINMLNQLPRKHDRIFPTNLARALYFIKLIINTSWNYFFFGLQSLFYGLVVILVMWIAIVIIVFAFARAASKLPTQPNNLSLLQRTAVL